MTCSVQTGRALAAAGLHPATGGDGIAALLGDMLLEALVACAGVTLKAVATALGIAVETGRCAPRATSTSAARWASTATRRSASRAIRLRFDLDTDADREQLATLLR